MHIRTISLYASRKSIHENFVYNIYRIPHPKEVYLKLSVYTRAIVTTLSEHSNYCVRPTSIRFYLFTIFPLLETVQNGFVAPRLPNCFRHDVQHASDWSAHLSWLRKVPEVIYRSYITRLWAYRLHKSTFI